MYPHIHICFKYTYIYIYVSNVYYMFQIYTHLYALYTHTSLCLSNIYQILKSGNLLDVMKEKDDQK